MTISAPRILMETEPLAWRLGAVVALILAVFGLSVSPEFSLINIGVSLTAGLISLLLKFKLPRGMLAVWIAILVLVWMSPMSGLPPDSLRVVFAVGAVAFSLAFQGIVPVYFIVLALGFGVALPTLSADLNQLNLLEILMNQSVLTLEIGLAVGVSLFWIRISHSRRRFLQSSLRSTLDVVEKTKIRTNQAHEGLQLTREMLLGRSHSDGEFAIGELGDLASTQPEAGASQTFDEVIAALRKAFSDFQTRGRAEGRISGPIRFVFFAPAAGYDEKSVIAVDLKTLTLGLDAVLSLALESLPEIGARKREGVVRLSVRYGLRVIEIAVEDNGRGLASRNLAAENSLNTLKEEVQDWGGKLDRIVRLGVGSRTSLELRIVREKVRAYRATLRHQSPIVSQVRGGTRA